MILRLRFRGRRLPHYFKGLLDDCQGEVSTVVDKAGNVVFRHFGELLLEYAFEASENDVAFMLAVVIDYAKFDVAVAFLDDCGLVEHLVSCGSGSTE